MQGGQRLTQRAPKKRSRKAAALLPVRLSVWVASEVNNYELGSF